MEHNERFLTEFIEIYRENKCLWDVKCEDYMNKQKRNASYEVLLEKFKEIKRDATLELLKRKINNLRTSFRRELKKVQESKRTGARGDIYEPTLWYYDLLLFTAQSEIAVDTIEEFKSKESTEAPLTPLSPESDVDIQTENEDLRNSSRSTFRSQKQSKVRKNSAENLCFKRKKRELLNLAHTALMNNDKDEYCIAGRRIGFQLRGLQDRQRFIAEKLISDVLFYARMGKLMECSTVQCNNVTTSTTHTLPSPTHPSSSQQNR